MIEHRRRGDICIEMPLRKQEWDEKAWRVGLQYVQGCHVLVAQGWDRGDWSREKTLHLSPLLSQEVLGEGVMGGDREKGVQRSLERSVLPHLGFEGVCIFWQCSGDTVSLPGLGFSQVGAWEGGTQGCVWSRALLGAMHSTVGKGKGRALRHNGSRIQCSDSPSLYYT